MSSNIKPVIGIEIDGKIYNYKLFESLDLLTKTYSQRKAAAQLGIAHSVFNRRILKAEKELGYKLVRNIGSGSEITQEGLKLLDIYYTYSNRLKPNENIRIAGGHIITGLLESLALPFSIEVYSTDNDSAFNLAKDDLIDMLALDDPLLAFRENLNFTPIAFDYMVLVSSFKNTINFKNNSHNQFNIYDDKGSLNIGSNINPSFESYDYVNFNTNKKIENIEDLQDLNFVAVKGTAQRLVWETLKDHDISFNIEKEVFSQFDAFKLVRNSDNLYTFLNASYFNGSDVLKNQTRHSIGFVHRPGYNKRVDDFVDYILNNCSDIIRLEGFTPIGF